ncbi:MAG: hypothetical protein KHY89_10300 [Butyricicoccus pullicaecorum]|nr:hypothetical protein [Butyricicoccus pullicaecorum]
MKKVWKKFSVVVLFISVLVLLLQSFRADEPRLGVALIGPYREDGVVILQYRVTNYENRPIQFENHKAMQGVIREFSSGHQISYDCPEQFIEIPKHQKYTFQIDLTDFPAGSYHASFSAVSGRTTATNEKQFQLPID